MLISPPWFRSISSDEQDQHVSSTRVLIRCLKLASFLPKDFVDLVAGASLITQFASAPKPIYFFLILQVATPSVSVFQHKFLVCHFDVNLPLDCQGNMCAFAESAFGCNTVVRPHGCVNNFMFNKTCMRIFLNPYKPYSYVYHLHIL